ncbi:MAG: hypothetical protein HFJ55_01390 [Clostridia bacterium]|nr:hypothetical protein [Clostridia bacterium]
MKNKEGITLIALVVTLIVLLILAGVSIALLIGENGVIYQARNAKENSREAEAREKLELTLLSAYNEKVLNNEYNQNEFLNNMITTEIEKAEIKGDIAIVDGYAYELDRSVPKIGRYKGKYKDLIFPEVDATVELAENAKTATITIKAKEKTKGINKIEIWQAGEKLEEFTYDNVKEEITQEYTAKQNGKYTIKAYADIMNSKTVEVEGILATVKFEPNGNNEWKKEHSTKVTIEEVEDKVINAKYQWTNSVIEPADETFTESFKSGDTITKNEITGTCYLWTMLEMKSGKKVKWRSEGFDFDNEGPNITEFTATKYSETGITLSATAQDIGFGTVKFEFYVDNVLKDTQTCSATTLNVTKSSTITGLTTGNHTCKVVVYDKEDNSSNKTITGTTKLYAWEKWNCVSLNRYQIEYGEWSTEVEKPAGRLFNYIL